MRLCIDIDGVLCRLRGPDEDYSAVEPLPGAVQALQRLKEEGHYIILSTARHMKTCDGNVGKVISRIGQKTLEWLERHSIPFDEIYFGKPWADLYIDDNAYRFEGWDALFSSGVVRSSNDVS